MPSQNIESIHRMTNPPINRRDKPNKEKPMNTNSAPLQYTLFLSCLDDALHTCYALTSMAYNKEDVAEH